MIANHFRELSMHVVIVGAGINGLVAANYLRRSGCHVTVIERAARVGGACVPATADIGGVRQDYAHGASVLGLPKVRVEKLSLKKKKKTKKAEEEETKK